MAKPLSLLNEDAVRAKNISPTQGRAIDLKNDDVEWISINQASKFMGINRFCFKDLLLQGYFKNVRFLNIRGRIKILKNDVRQWLKQNTQEFRSA